jgi:replicative DNA helicase
MDPTELLRQPPFSRDAEEAVLGALLLAPTALPKVAEFLQPEDFYNRGHGLLYAAIRQAVAELPADGSQTMDCWTLGDRIEGTELHTQWGWTPVELVDLMTHTPSAANIRAYADIIREHSAKRQLISAYMQGIESLYSDRTRGAAEIAAKVHQATVHITGRAERSGGLRPMKEFVRSWFHDLQGRYERGETITGLCSPWAIIDAKTFGWQPKHLITVAGRPGMGKSIFGWEQAVHTGAQGKRAAIFSLEMGGDELVQRSVSSRGRVPWDFLRSPRAWRGGDDEEFWARTATIAGDMAQSKILIDETPSLTIGQIESRAERAHMEEPLALIVLDHLHLTDIEQKSNQNKADALGKVSGGLKRLAKRLNIPVMALAQLNRGNTQRPDKRPTMADLRDSGAIEQDSDVVLLLHRDDYYQPPGTPKTHRTEVIWGKGRGLPAGDTTVLRDRYDQMRLEEWGEDGPPEPAPEPTTPREPARSWGRRGSKAIARQDEE